MKTLDYAHTMTLFARNLKNLREQNGITQDKLSEISGVDRSYISGCESGQRNPSIDILVKLASALQTSISMFFDEMNDNLLQAPLIDKRYFRNVPLPEKLFIEQIATALQETQNFFTLIRHTSGINLSSIIQGNNFLELYQTFLRGSYLIHLLSKRIVGSDIQICLVQIK
jgi:transcriptional regulator with XRE-family HTH domain